MIFSAEILAKELSRKKFVDRVAQAAQVKISNIEAVRISEVQFLIVLDMTRFSIAESGEETSLETYRLTVPSENSMLSVDVMQDGYRHTFHAICAARVGWEIEMDILHCLHQEHFFYENE